jgi:hypothetical protein
MSIKVQVNGVTAELLKAGGLALARLNASFLWLMSQKSDFCFGNVRVNASALRYFLQRITYRK